jgi:hypothetical protein
MGLYLPISVDIFLLRVEKRWNYISRPEEIETPLSLKEITLSSTRLADVRKLLKLKKTDSTFAKTAISLFDVE